jgi:hypothetical protein
MNTHFPVTKRTFHTLTSSFPMYFALVVFGHKLNNSVLSVASQSLYDVEPKPVPNPAGGRMKRLLAAFAFLSMTTAFAAPIALTQKQELAKTSLKVGDTAPDFTLLSDQWKPVKLSDFKGKKNVLLAIYVLAFTGG